MMNYWKKLALIFGFGVMFVFIAQLITRNFYIAASVEYASETAKQDSLRRTRQALISGIASLESPARLRELGAQLGLVPLPLESFVLMEAQQ